MDEYGAVKIESKVKPAHRWLAYQAQGPQFPRGLRAAGHDIERQALQFHRQIDANQAHGRRQADGDRGEVHDSFHAGGHEFVGHRLSGSGRHHNHAQLDALLDHNFCQPVEVVDRHAFNIAARLRGLHVERRHDAEVLLPEAAIAEQGPTQVTDADHGDRPGSIGAQNMTDRGNQLLASVSDAGIAKVAEVGQIFADLGIGQTEQVAQVAGTGGLMAVSHQMLQFPQIQAEPIDDGFGHRAIGLDRRLVFGHGHRDQGVWVSRFLRFGCDWCFEFNAAQALGHLGTQRQLSRTTVNHAFRPQQGNCWGRKQTPLHGLGACQGRRGW